MKYTVEVIRRIEQRKKFTVDAEDEWDAVDAAEKLAMQSNWDKDKASIRYISGNVSDEEGFIHIYESVCE